MYAPQLGRLRALRRRYDPQGPLLNEHITRLFNLDSDDDELRAAE